jgi:aminoglycoside/choline kinase family phosphotransferase
MDANPALDQDVRPFISITDHLEKLKLSAPNIKTRDIPDGFLVLEDLGDDLFAHVLKQRPELEQTLYRAAVDVLLHLHQAPPPSGVKTYTPELMCHLASLAFEWYVDLPDLKTAFIQLMRPVLEDLIGRNDVLALRDYHAENLIWRPDRTGLRRVGLLDYQDAMLCHPAYDLISLLRDARRDVTAVTRDALIDYYVQRTDQDSAMFRSACAVLGVQRNLRILLIFARLSIGYGKPKYVDLIPRVWAHLIEDLKHPHLAALRNFLLDHLPAPSTEYLQTLKDQCNTRPIH